MKDIPSAPASTEAGLAPYASRSSASRGRAHPEPAHPYRCEFQRDRDRIIHSRPFRRLEYKTQVFINGTADHYRTRLTHTIEAAAVGRTLARALRVHEDLAEAIALAHDIGHSPFGHCGEHALDELMDGHGGFDHNLQSLRWVELLEPRYPGFDGLNLTWETRAGLRKHLAHDPAQRLDGHPIGPFQSLEAQIVDVADDITYLAHDTDDGLDADLLALDALDRQPLWQRALDHARRAYGRQVPPERLRNMAVRALLDIMVADVLDTARERLEAIGPGSPEEVMTAPRRIAALSPELGPEVKAYKDFLFEHMYWHPRVAQANEEAVRLMRELFLYYVHHPEAMGAKARARIDAQGLWRTACDYVSGMTDRYALEEVHRFGLDRGGGPERQAG